MKRPVKLDNNIVTKSLEGILQVFVDEDSRVFLLSKHLNSTLVLRAQGPVIPETLNRVWAELEVSLVPNPLRHKRPQEPDLLVRLTGRDCGYVFGATDIQLLAALWERLTVAARRVNDYAQDVRIFVTQEATVPPMTDEARRAATTTWASLGQRVKIKGEPGVWTVTGHYSDIDGGVRITRENLKAMPESWNVDALEPA